MYLIQAGRKGIVKVVVLWAWKPGILGANSDGQLIHCTGIGTLFNLSSCWMGREILCLRTQGFSNH